MSLILPSPTSVKVSGWEAGWISAQWNSILFSGGETAPVLVCCSWGLCGRVWVNCGFLLYLWHPQNTWQWGRANVTWKEKYLLISQLVWGPNRSHVGIKQLMRQPGEPWRNVVAHHRNLSAVLPFLPLGPEDRLSWVSVAVKRLLKVGSSTQGHLTKVCVNKKPCLPFKVFMLESTCLSFSMNFLKFASINVITSAMVHSFFFPFFKNCY